MKIEIEQLKTLAENGDKAALESYILSSIEKSDVETVTATNAEVKSYFDSEKDKHTTAALNTWKTNNLDKIVNEELSKRNPGKSPLEIQIEELQKKYDDSERANKREKLMNQAIKQATDKGLPVDLLDFFVSDDEESTNANISKLEEAYTRAVQSAVDGKFKDNGRDVNAGGTGSAGIKSIQDMAAAHNIRNQQGGNN